MILNSISRKKKPSLHEMQVVYIKLQVNNILELVSSVYLRNTHIWDFRNQSFPQNKAYISAHIQRAIHSCRFSYMNF